MAEAPSKAAAYASRALASAWRHSYMKLPVMDADALEAEALRGADPAALGPDTGWREPFRRLTEALRSEANLNPIGLAMAYGQIIQVLRSRMRAVALWARYPGILDTPIAPPIIILGPMRSGTTRLQRLLACDERFTHTRAFESLFPVPYAPRGFDSRPWRASLALTAVESFNPALAVIHPTRARDPEEEFGLISFSFGPPQFEAQWHVPSFTAWWEAADKAFLYRETRQLLQTILWRRRARVDRPWVLKAPQFMEDLPAVLDAFPGARLLCLHRPLEAVVGSTASLVWNQMRIQSDRADPAWIGQEWLRKTRHRLAVAGEARRHRPDVPQLDLDYGAMDRDWRGEIGRIYDFLGLDVPPTLEARMAKWLGRSRRHHGHRYTLDQFGLTPAALA